MSIGGELARLMMEQAVDEQAQGKPSEQSLAREGEIATVTKTDQAALETPAGAVRWDQPKARLKAQRRDFFPLSRSHWELMSTRRSRRNYSGR